MTPLTRMVLRALSEKTKAPTNRVPMIVHFSAPVGNVCLADAVDMTSVPARFYGRLQGAHLVSRLLRPLRVARPVFDRYRHRQPRAQVWPALVLLDQNTHRHALHHIGEF